MRAPDDAASSYDAIVVGASIAGCTTAIMLGRAGLRVALVERSRHLDAYKALCGHWILGGAKPTLVRLGPWQEMLAHGAEAALPDMWSGGRWLTLPRGAGIPEAISRGAAHSTPCGAASPPPPRAWSCSWATPASGSPRKGRASPA